MGSGAWSAFWKSLDEQAQREKRLLLWLELLGWKLAPTVRFLAKRKAPPKVVRACTLQGVLAKVEHAEVRIRAARIEREITAELCEEHGFKLTVRPGRWSAWHPVHKVRLNEGSGAELRERVRALAQLAWASPADAVEVAP